MYNSPKILPTHETGVSITLNTKYVSRSFLNRYLIVKFMRAITALAGIVKPKSVLDVGCGEGMVLRQLGLLWKDIYVQGLDLEFDLLKTAQQVAVNYDYLVGDIFQLPITDHSYDLVICTEVLEHLSEPEKALAELMRIGKGYYILSVPYEPFWRIGNVLRGKYLSDWGNTPTHLNHWTKKGFIRFVENYLDVIQIRNPFPWTILLGKSRFEKQFRFLKRSV